MRYFLFSLSARLMGADGFHGRFLEARCGKDTEEAKMKLYKKFQDIEIHNSRGTEVEKPTCSPEEFDALTTMDLAQYWTRFFKEQERWSPYRDLI